MEEKPNNVDIYSELEIRKIENREKTNARPLEKFPDSHSKGALLNSNEDTMTKAISELTARLKTLEEIGRKNPENQTLGLKRS